MEDTPEQGNWIKTSAGQNGKYAIVNSAMLHQDLHDSLIPSANRSVTVRDLPARRAKSIISWALLNFT